MSFLDFVAIKLDDAPERSTDYKALTSYSRSADGSEGMPVEDTLRTWIAGMIDKGLTPASRRRYTEKLSTIYKEYAAGHGTEGDPFTAIRDLRDFKGAEAAKSLQSITERLARIFDILMSEARLNPALAVFVYLLFNSSSDIDSAITLTVDDYVPTFPQLEDIINTEGFHHRRRYVFDLGQSRKRMPQLRSEVLTAINAYLRAKDIMFPAGFSNKTIPAMWAARARAVGLSLSDIRYALGDIPAEYAYLRYVGGPVPAPERIRDMKQKVAESFAPFGRKWYAVKLRRNVKFDMLMDCLIESYDPHFDPHTLFYPCKEITRRIDKKIVTESIPVIPDVVFLNIRPGQVRKIDMLVRSEGYGWMFRTANRADSDYSVIDRRSMLAFQRVIGTLTHDMKVSLTRETPVGIGRQVRITGGIMEGYTGTIYDIKDGSDVRQLYIRLSDDYAIRAEIKVEEYYVEPLQLSSK